MITEFKTKDGYIYSYCIWTTVNHHGITVNGGKYLYIDEIWVHDAHRKRGMRELIKELNRVVPHNVRHVYWIRRKYNLRASRLYSRERLSKLGG